MNDFADAVHRHRQRRGWSLRRTAREAGYSGHAYLSRVLSGSQPPTPALAVNLDRVLSAGGEITAAARAPAPGAGSAPVARAGSGEVSVRKSAADAAGLVMAAGRDRLDPSVLAQAHDDITRMLAVYTSAAGADLEVLQEATALRRALQQMTSPYRETPQAADIFLLSGMLSGICSYISLDLGDADAAATQSRAAFVMGDLARHDGLRAWSCGTLALIARFQDRHADALRCIERGLPYATGGTSLARLRCGQGQALAHMGDADGAVRCLNLARDAREHVTSPDLAAGVFTFSEAKQTYYTGSSLQWLPGQRNAAAAEKESADAIRMFRASNPASRGRSDELLAHVYLGNARLTLGAVDGTMSALQPVLTLPEQERSAWHRKRVAQIGERLARGRVSGSKLAIEAREEIAAFTRPQR